VYTDSEGLEIFQSPKNRKQIQILGLTIGGKPYIDQQQVRAAKKKAARDRIIFFTVIYVIYLSVYFYKRKEMDNAAITSDGSPR
jgi:hypothetical protein